MIELLGVKISENKRNEVDGIINDFLNDGGVGLKKIFTPNPEMLVLAQNDESFRAVLNSANLAIADGVGLQYLAILTGQKKPDRMTGNEILVKLLEVANKRGESVFIIGGRDIEAGRLAKEKILGLYPRINLKIISGIEISYKEGAQSEAPSMSDSAARGGSEFAPPRATGNASAGAREWIFDRSILAEIENFRPSILVVALGHGKQEKWITDFAGQFKTVRIAIGVGGAIDFMSGKITRAPEWMQKTGLEFLFRLVNDPKRFRRIINAVIVFPCLAIKYQLLKSRKNV